MVNNLERKSTFFFNVLYEKKEVILLSQKARTQTKNSTLAKTQHKNATKFFDYTAILDRLRTASWSSDNTRCHWYNIH